ncbi:MAG: ParB/RepB/Spo0J family partition protein [Desulfobacterales bacterium]|nr:MAG: ParB/RepB/Spo0J family partition protein [Desulfobacterales bacterium]
MQREKVTKRSGSGPAKRKKMALGKGLEALIPELDSPEAKPPDYFNCAIELIRPNRFQPRHRFPEDEMEELSQSIKAQGILQPLLVREDHGGYELIAGERRLRAAQKAGLNHVPVVLKRISDAQLLEISIVENIQRENLNPMEEAEAYHRLITEFNLTQDQAAVRVGKSRSAVANFLRLRQLPAQIKTSISDGTLSMGHARALLGVETTAQQIAAWRAVISKGLSVRETEALIRRLKTARQEPVTSPANSDEIYFKDLADNLSRHFGTKVSIKKKGRKGKVEIEFYSEDDLHRLIELLKEARF